MRFNNIRRFFFTDTNYILGKKDNVEFQYNLIAFLLSFLAQYSKERFIRPAAVTKTDYRPRCQPLACSTKTTSDANTGRRRHSRQENDLKLGSLFHNCIQVAECCGWQRTKYSVVTIKCVDSDITRLLAVS